MWDWDLDTDLRDLFLNQALGKQTNVGQPLQAQLENIHLDFSQMMFHAGFWLLPDLQHPELFILEDNLKNK